MAVNKNFVVKNGLEVNSNLILANPTTKNVGIGSTSPRFKLDVSGGIGATTLNVTGIGTIVTFRSDSGIITSLSGTTLNYNGVSTVTNINGVNLNYSGICTVGTISVTSSSGTNLNFTGIATIGGVKISSGIVTSASPGITTVVYYGDGSKLTNVGGIPVGPTFAIQYNDAGFFGGSSNFTYNTTNVTLTGGAFIGNLSGNVTGNADTATTATNANNINISATTSTDATTSVVLVANQSTGNQSPFIDSGLLYNANTNNLTATSFTGNLVGNADTATTATNANNINISSTTSTDTTTSVVLVGNQATGNQSPFIDSGLLYNANTDTLSASIFSGALSGNATSATTATNANNINISATSSVDTNTFLVLVGNNATGNQSPFIDLGLYYNANTDTLFATTFSGALNGNATTATTATTAQGLTGSPNITVGTINSGNIDAISSTVTASAFVDDGTNLLDAINAKPSTGKAIAMSMIFG